MPVNHNKHSYIGVFVFFARVLEPTTPILRLEAPILEWLRPNAMKTSTLVSIMTIHFQVFGLWFSTANGNCFAPALQLNYRGLTVRTSHGRETNISRRSDGSFWWNSDHIACWFGKYYPGDEQRGYPDIYEYNGILGCHQYIA